MKFLVLAFLLLAAPALARPVVVELFTSQACSSCPPADELLASLAGSDKNILPLSFNVTYWNSPAWQDKDSLQMATDRQIWYAGLAHTQQVYTPEAVVDGGAGLVGSDRDAVTSAITAAQAAPAGDVPININGKAMVTISVPAGAGGANVLVFGYDSKHKTKIGGGENGGATLTEINVVRSETNLGPWIGPSLSFTISRPAGEHVAVLLQADDGKIYGGATH
jgi:hypothetical protein